MEDFHPIVWMNSNQLKDRLVDWGKKKQEAIICCLQETQFNYKDTYEAKVNRWNKIHHANTNQSKLE